LFIGITLLFILIAWNYWDKKEEQEKWERLDAQNQYINNDIETVLEKSWELDVINAFDKPVIVNLMIGSEATTALIEMRLDKDLKIIYRDVEISDLNLFYTHKELISWDIEEKYCSNLLKAALEHAGFEWVVNVQAKVGQDSYRINCPKSKGD
jgi:hypothetical protein